MAEDKQWSLCVNQRWLDGDSNFVVHVVDVSGVVVVVVDRDLG